MVWAQRVRYVRPSASRSLPGVPPVVRNRASPAIRHKMGLMRVHLVNPSSLSFGIGVITPRWLYVLAAATPRSYGDPMICDETLAQLDSAQFQPGDVVGIGIHSGNCLRGYEVGRMARERGAHVIFGGIHTSLYPQEAFQHGGAHAVVKGDGDVIWARVLADCANGLLQQVYEGGRIEAGEFFAAR